MKLTQVKGSTWVLEANELIPLYLLDDRRCVLLDSGLAKEREEIEKTLLEAGLEPAGILCSHAHVDHCANNRYFQEKYHLPVALTAPEAGMCSSILNLKCYRLLVSPDAAEQEMSEMVHVPDLILPPVDGPIRLAGAMFRILHTPGHSSGHICAVTPDNVCYTGDALMSQRCWTPSCLTACPSSWPWRAGSGCRSWRTATSLSWLTRGCAPEERSAPSSTPTRSWCAAGQRRSRFPGMYCLWTVSPCSRTAKSTGKRCRKRR